MTALGLYGSLLWRTLAALFLFGFAIGLVFGALFQVGIEVGIDIPLSDIQLSVTYIKLKPTILYLASASVILFSEFVFPANIIRALGGKRLPLSSSDWRRYALELAALFALIAVINVIIAFTASTSIWVNYKIYGATLMLFAGMYVLAYRLSNRIKK